jgi:hypothetical protein
MLVLHFVHAIKELFSLLFRIQNRGAPLSDGEVSDIWKLFGVRLGCERNIHNTSHTKMEDTISNGIYTTVKPFYCVCKILGQVSYSYSRTTNSNRVTIVHGFFHTVYSIAWTLFCVIATAYTFLTLKNCDSEILPEKVLIGCYVYYIAVYAASLVCLVHGVIFRGRRHSLILTKLSLVDTELFKAHEETRVNRKTMFTAIAEIVFVFVYNVAMGLYYNYSNTQESCFTTLLLSFECVVTYCNTMTVMQYCNLVRVIQERYKHINKHLSSYVNASCAVICETSDTPVQGHSVRLRAGSKISLFASSRNCRSIKAIQLRSLRVIFSELNHIMRLFNEDCGIPVLATTMWILVDIVLVAFFTLLDAEYGTFTGIGYLITSLCLITKLASSCHAAGSENDLSKFLVQKLLLDDTLQPKDIEELKMLSLQLNSSTVEYSAYGFFVLNLQFLCSVIGVIISYVVIIVQIK